MCKHCCICTACYSRTQTLLPQMPYLCTFSLIEISTPHQIWTEESNQALGVDFNPTSSSNCVTIYCCCCCCCCLRHWQKLMESTGKNFDMNPETFTLENLFAMELHNFADTISDIVGSANKELSIEKSLNEVVTTWHSQRFSIHK